jgi:hypothetical protein
LLLQVVVVVVVPLRVTLMQVVAVVQVDLEPPHLLRYLHPLQ